MATLPIPGFCAEWIQKWCEQRASELGIQWVDMFRYVNNCVPGIRKNGYEFDRRHKITQEFSKLMRQNTDNVPTPRKLDEQKLKQGDRKSKDILHEDYHSAQDKLLELPQFDKYESSKKGLWQYKNTKAILTPDEFCGVIENFASKLYRNAQRFCGTRDTSYVKVEPDFNHSVLEVCRLRMLHGTAMDNNIRDEKQWNIWVEHNKVIVSFVILYCAIEFHTKKLSKAL